MTILRKWTGRIRTTDREAYVRYIIGTGLDDYGATPGNLGYEMLVRDLDDGTSEVTTTSWWRDVAAIAAFAGEDITLARYYPEDDHYLLDQPERVEHHDVVAGQRCTVR